MNIHTWKVSINDEVVAQVLNCIVGIERPRVVAKTIGGYVHVQSVGEPMKYADLNIFSTLREKARFDELEAEGYEVSFVYRGVKYFGYFEQAVSWNAYSPGEYYAAQGKLLINAEEVFEEPEPDYPDPPNPPDDPGDTTDDSAVLGRAVLGTMILGKDAV